MNSLDARVRYTRMVIENAFMELLKEKSAARITVTEICQAAQINRATFYKHYLDVPDLLEQIEDRLLSELKTAIGEIPESGEVTEEVLLDKMEKMFSFIKSGASQYMILAGDGADPSLPMKTFQLISSMFYPVLAQRIPEKSDAYKEMLYHFLTLGFGGALMTWIRRGMQEDCRELAKFLLSLSMGATSMYQ